VNVGHADNFDISAEGNTTTYRVWFNYGSATAPSGGTDVVLVPVVITGTETDAQVATLIYNALNVYSDFTIPVPVGNTIVVTNTLAGPANIPTSHVLNHSFTIGVTTYGGGDTVTDLHVGISTAATPAQQVDETARSLVKIINQNPNGTVYAFYLSGPTDVPGLIQIEARTLGTTPFYLQVDDSGTGVSFSPNLSPTNSITAVTNGFITTVTSVAHGLSTGDQIVITNSDSTPTIDGVWTVTVIDANTFTITATTTVNGTVGVWNLTSKATVSDNNVSPK
jgi:hypothetical protein